MNLEMALEALELPSLSREDMVRANRLNVQRAPFAAGDWMLHFGGPRLTGDAVALQLQSPWAEVELVCAVSLIDKFLGSLQVDLRTPDVKPDLLSLLLELALEKHLATSKWASNFEIVVPEPTGDVTPELIEVTVTLDAFDQRWPFTIRGTSEALDAVFRGWPAVSRELPNVWLPAVLRLGSTRLTNSLLTSLRPGDALLFERVHAALPKCLAVVSASWAASMTFSAEGWRLDQPFAPLSAEERNWMSSNDKTMASMNIADPDDIPVTVGFDLGEIEMPIADLRRLAAGAILEMPRPGQAPVRVTANGRPVGSGELVRVEGRIAVKLLRIFDHG